MPVLLKDKLKHAWNAFRNRDPTEPNYQYVGTSYYSRPDRNIVQITTERSMIASLYNQIALDVASIPIYHVRTDQNGRYEETIPSKLNYALTEEANIDQASTAFKQDVVMSLIDEGCVAVVPTITSIDPSASSSYEIHSLRTGKIMEWYPNHVRVRLYNEETGERETLLLEKKHVAIIENPFYAIMNQPNSTLKRLTHKLNLLDSIDEQSGSGKLDILIQLPYVIKSAARRERAEERRKDIEMQLAGSKYGIAYIDGSEKVTQLNRPAENNLMAQIQYLTSMLYSQLGITEDVFTGKADEATMLNYFNRTTKPILKAILEEFRRKFLTKTARSQNQTLMYFKDAFSLVPATEIANAADKFTRNEILTSNEIRSIIGFKPAKDAAADELRNKNLNPAQPEEAQEQAPEKTKGVSSNEDEGV